MFDTSNLRDYTLNTKNILSLVDGLTLFKYYCPEFDGSTKKFSSPLRTDDDPSCTIKLLDSGYIYRDHAKGYSLDIFGFVQQKYMCSFVESLNIINTDFKLNLGYGKPKESLPSMGFFGLPDLITKRSEIKKSTIKVQIRNWNSKDRTYWYDKYFINTDLLKKYQVYPLNYYCLNDNWFHKPEFCYGYYCQNEEWKIYQPFNKEYKFINNIQPGFYCGYKQLSKTGDTLVITSSRKDVLCWSVLGYQAISPQSETTNIKKEFIQELQSRFKRVFVNFDQDLAGHTEANKYDLPKIFTPEHKDISDTLEYKGLEYTKELVKQLIK